MRESIIASIARTPIGSFLGSLSTVSAAKLGAIAIKEAVIRANLKPDNVDEVIMGNVLSANIGQAPARQASIYAGLPNSVECMTINKVCGSGLKAVMLADQAIRCSDNEVIVSGGMENMSMVPYYLNGIRKGMKMGNDNAIDGLIHDGLWDPYSNMHMGNCAEVLSNEKKISRKKQDEFAIESYERSLKAIHEGLFEDEITPVEIPQKNGNSIIVDIDEEPKRGKLDGINKLRTAFDKNGTITAANASSINDGAAALVVMEKEKAKAMGIKPMCKIVSHVSVAHDPLYFTTAPSKAISKVLDKSKLSIDDIDLFEINEAFSNVAISAIEELSISIKKVNVHGGAVSLGHPIGASGARILVTLISALKQRNQRFGLATLCIGGGEAAAMIVEVL